MNTALASTPTQHSAIYCKSEKGLDEMASRKYGLSLKLRSVLIMIDGKRSFRDLAKMAANFGSAEEILSHLVEGGYVEAISGKVGAGGSSAANAAASSADFNEFTSLPEAARQAVAFLNEHMGTLATTMCARLQAASTLEEFKICCMRAQTVLTSVKGAAIAERFADEVTSRLISPNATQPMMMPTLH